MRATWERLEKPPPASLERQRQEGEDAPGDRNAAVATGNLAVLLLRVDHRWINPERRAGVDDWTGSREDRNAD